MVAEFAILKPTDFAVDWLVLNFLAYSLMMYGQKFVSILSGAALASSSQIESLYFLVDVVLAFAFECGQRKSQM